jgi:stage II sporulation protein GA (sporulation sigma-E factor processing peptidase)
MAEIYIEYAVAENMFVNFALLLFVYKTVKCKPKFWRMFFAAALGTIFAVLLPLLSFTGAASVAVKLSVGAAMVFICQHKNFARWALFYLLFLTYTFALGGAVYAVSDRGVSPYLTMGVLLIMFGVLNYLIKFLNIRASIGGHLRDLIIYYGDNKFRINSFADTGNRLIDPRSNAPVCIISLALFIKMFPEIEVDKLILNKLGDEITDGHYINYATVADASQKMFVFAPDKVEIVGGKSTHNVRLGVTMRGFGGAVKYDALLHVGLL